MSVDEQQSVVAQLDEAFAKMALAKLSHGDLKASNLIWCKGRLYFIDLDAAQQHRSAISWQASHNKDRKRFLRNWKDQPQLLALFNQL